jgi:hypothetical protein
MVTNSRVYRGHRPGEIAGAAGWRHHGARHHKDDTAMRTAILPALLLPAMLAALPAMAQTTSWSRSSLVFTGGGTDGCAIGLNSATHAGGPASEIS